MPYLFIDDGAPEATEYADNYRWFAAEALPAVLSSLRSPRSSGASPCRDQCSCRPPSRPRASGSQSPIVTFACCENASPLRVVGGST